MPDQLGKTTTSENSPDQRSWFINKNIIYSAIFFSGLAALMYELIWIRVFNLVFGVSSLAIATVISVFLLGLGLGSYFFGRRAERSINILRTYGYLELAIAITSMTAFVIITYTPLFSSIHHYLYNSANIYILSIVRCLLTVIILLVPTMCIGGTIPLLSKYLIRNNITIGSTFSGIYFINTLGAFAGALATGLLLVQRLGTLGAFCCAAALNVLIFLVVQFFKKRAASIIPGQTAGVPVEKDRPRRFMLPILFITGFIALGFEILWVRILTNFGSGTTLSSTLILGGFLAGLALGSWYVARRVDRLQQPLNYFSVYAILTGLAASIILFFFGSLNNYFSEQFLSYTTLLTESWVGFGLAFILAAFVGTLFPLGCRIYMGSAETIGKKTGTVYLVNAFGTVAGSLATGFFLIPFLGIKNSALILIGLCFSVAVIAIFKTTTSKRKLIPALIGGIVIAYFISANGGQVFHRLPASFEEIFYAEGLSATVTVQSLKSATDPYKMLSVDSQIVAGTYATGIIDSKILAHLPLLLLDHPSRAATVGYGSGGTSYSMLQYKIPVYALEIEKEVINAGQKFQELNHGARDDSNLHIIIDDARNYLHNSTLKFDTIVTDVTNLKYKSNPYLYTREYFQIMKNALEPDGLAAAWVPLGGLSFTDLRILMATFQSVYPHTTVWYYNIEPTGFLVFIGSPEKINIDLNKINERMSAVQTDLTEIYLDNAYEVAGMLLLGEDDVRQLGSGMALHTDNNPILEFTDLEAYARANQMENLKQLVAAQTEILQSYYTYDADDEQPLLQELHLGRERMLEYYGE
ncbi:MAG: fused MFS/spermidine synthase [Patescibacteria group bacterium]|jgi:spermidine synthase